MRILFMGADELACPSLREIASRENDEVVGIITQPDRPKGRNRKLAPCPLKALAENEYNHIPVLTPLKLSDPGFLDDIQALRVDIIAVVAYGEYIPASILDAASHSGINLHPSLLPEYRGASPIQRAIADGKKITGVTILYVAEELDAGDVILQETVEIGENDTAVTLSERLAEEGAMLLCRALDMLEETGSLPRIPQDESRVTYVSKLTKEDGRIDWSLPAETIRNRIRGFQPWPCCYFEWPSDSGRRLKVYSARVEKGAGAPGELLAVDGDGPLVASGQDALRIMELQPEGKRVMTGKEFLCGYQPSIGEKLG